MTRRILLGLIGAAAAIFVFTNLVYRAYGNAALCLLVGVIWILLEAQQRSSMPSLFFLFFVGMSLAGVLNSQPVVLLLTGLSVSLAAWDLARFRARVGELLPELEHKHLQKLAITGVTGLLIGWLASGIRVSINFVTLAALLLLAMIMLRYAIVYLREQGD